MTDRRKGTDRRAGMVNVEVGETGSHKILDPSSIHSSAADAAIAERDKRIHELEAENQSLRIKLMTAQAAMKFTPAQLESLKGLVKDIGEVLAKEDYREKAA